MAKTHFGWTLLAAALAVMTLARAPLGAEAPVPKPSGASGDWPQWRGPDRNGVARSSPKLMDVLPPEGPKLVWKSESIPFGGTGGWGSVAVAEGKVFLYVYWKRSKEEGSRITDTLVCLDAATGKTLWKKEYETKGGGSYPWSATPAVSNGKVCFGGLTGVYCLSTKDGSELWHKPGGGTQASLLIADGLVYDPATRTAYDLETGKPLWQPKDFQGGSGDSSPVLWKNGGKTYILIKGICLDMQNGNVLWKGVKQNEATPVVAGDEMIAASSLYTLTPQGASRVWGQVWGTLGEWRCSPLVHQGVLYQSDGGNQTYICAELQTGAVKWSKGQTATDMSSPILADGKIISLCGPGHSHNNLGCSMVIFKATPDRYEEVGRFDAHAGSCESPAIADGRVYFRTENPKGEFGVACYDLAEHRPYIASVGFKAGELRLEVQQADGGLAAAGAIQGLSVKDASGAAQAVAARLDGNALVLDTKGLTFPLEIAYDAGNLTAKNGPLAPFRWRSPYLTFFRCEGRTLSFDLRGSQPADLKAWADANIYEIAGAKVTGVEVKDWSVRLTTDKAWKMTDALALRYPAMPGDATLAKLDLKASAGLLGYPVDERPLQEFLFGPQRKGVPPEDIEKTLLAEAPQYKDLQPARGEDWKIWNIQPGGTRYALNPDYLGVGQVITPASVYVFANQDRKVQFLYKHFGCGVQIAVNGQVVATNPKELNDHAKHDEVKDVALKQGWNTVVLTMAGVSRDFWQFDFNLSIRDEAGKPVTGLWYRADKPGDK